MAVERGSWHPNSAPSRHLFVYTNATTIINGCNTRQSSSTYVCQTQMTHERGIETIRDFLHTIWLSRVDLLTCYFTSSRHFFCYINATTMINRCNTRQSSSTYVCQTQMTHERGIETIRTFLHTIWLSRKEVGTPTLHHQDTSSTIPTQRL